MVANKWASRAASKRLVTGRKKNSRFGYCLICYPTLRKARPTEEMLESVT